MKTMRLLPMTVVSLATLLAPQGQAQTLSAIEGTPEASFFDLIVPTATPGFPLGSLAPFAPPSAGGTLGGTTVDRTTDTFWYTDGFQIVQTRRDGAILAVLGAPGYMGPLTGISFDGPLGLIWMTDGANAAAAQPIPGLPVVVPPFPVAGFVVGIGWNPFTATVWVVDINADVTEYPAGGGAPLSGFAAPLGSASGLTIDATNGNIVITDGVTNLVTDLFGNPVGGFPHQPNAFTPAPFATMPISGLGFSSGGSWLCPGFSSVGPVPKLTVLGQCTSPSPNFGIMLENGVPGDPAYLFAGLNPGATPLGGCGAVLCMAYPWNMIGPFTIDAAGRVALGGGFPPGIPVGTPIRVQWVTVSAGCLHTSDGELITVSLP